MFCFGVFDAFDPFPRSSASREDHAVRAVYQLEEELKVQDNPGL